VRILLDFKCSDNHITESLVASEVSEHTCKTCGKPAKRIISPVRFYIDPLSGDSVGATRKWAKQRQQKIEKERKASYSQ